jgi:hypothetical protein
MQGDCLERMKEIPDGSVDMILTDPPYGTVKGMILKGQTKDTTKWDTTISHEKMLKECNRVLRVNGSLLLFAQDPYTGELMTKQHGNLPFSYRMTWLKDHFASPLSANKAPVNYTEDICVFFKKYDQLNQHPLRDYVFTLFKFIGKNKKQLFAEMGHQGVCHFMRYETMQFGLCTEKTYNELISMYGIGGQVWFKPYSYLTEVNRKFSRKFNLQGKKFKSNVLSYKKDYQGLHPTQKPVLLLEDLIKTYTNEGETVLDFTMGSGSTGVACKNLNRNFIGIELDEEYFKIAQERISAT